MTRAAACLLAVLLAGCRHADGPPPNDLADRERIGRLVVELSLPDAQKVEAARQELIRAGEAAVPRLIVLANTGKPAAAARAIEVLAAIGAREAVAPICSLLLRSPHAEVRLAAARALAMLASPLAVKGIASHLPREESAEVRVACLAALGATNDPAAAQAAFPCLRDPAELVRAAALDVVEARRPEGASDAVAAMYAWLPPSGAWREKERLLADLVAWKDARACDLLLDALANPFSSPTRREAARLLGELGDPRGVAALIEAIGDSRPEVALASHQSLARLTGRADAPAASVDDAKGRATLRAEWKTWMERRR